MSFQLLEKYKRRRCSSSSDSSNEEIMNFISEIEKPVNRKFRDRSNALLKYNNAEFKEKFTFSKETINFITNMISSKIRRFSKRNCPLSAEEQILLTINFFVTGSFQSSIGEDGNVHKSTVSRIIRSVTKEITNLKEIFINMPKTETELNIVNKGFKNICQFPNVLSCIDSIHIPIISPGGPTAELYRRKKGKCTFSVRLQFLCDSELKIRDINARSYGSYSKMKVFNESSIKDRLDSLEFTGNYLLGDNEYTCREYLLPPLPNPTTINERKYNEFHDKAMKIANKTSELLKNRFLCLSNGLRTKIHTTLEIIEACIVLHNIAVIRKDYYEIKSRIKKKDDDLDDNSPRKYQVLEDDENDIDVRQNLIQNL